jgi:hypothetical protein
LPLRKVLLVAESELNRAQLLGDWRAMTAGLKSAGAFASAAGLLMAGWAAFRRERASARKAKASWWEMAIKGAEMAGSAWMSFRAR